MQKAKKTRAIAVSSEIETITPTIAREYLAKDMKNRNLSIPTTTAYVRDMKAGKWVINKKD